MAQSLPITLWPHQFAQRISVLSVLLSLWNGVVDILALCLLHLGVLNEDVPHLVKVPLYGMLWKSLMISKDSMAPSSGSHLIIHIHNADIPSMECSLP